MVRRTRYLFQDCILFIGNLTSLWIKKSLGDPSGSGTPGLIPNPVVKAASADGTWGATPGRVGHCQETFLL